jgi:hypothetical protein
MAAARDTIPIYFERCMIDRSNRPADVQQQAEDRIVGDMADLNCVTRSHWSRTQSGTHRPRAVSDWR